ncbi:MAG: 5-formyltetrahydrofolate cyclo-ligase [Steroidobacteraceae bacterium]
MAPLLLPFTDVRETRKRLRARRRDIPDAARLAADQVIRRELARLRIWRRGQRVAAFIGMPDEVDLRPSFPVAWNRGVRLFVPLILQLRSGAMTFVPFEQDVPLHRNRFGIDEPVTDLAGRVNALQLDTVLVPLVGFDAEGHRLGMGAGFYDRALARRRDRTQPFRRPRLVGVAYSVQQVERIPAAPWDVALDAVVTERGILNFAS